MLIPRGRFLETRDRLEPERDVPLDITVSRRLRDASGEIRYEPEAMAVRPWASSRDLSR
jgi:hypothetical protein